MWYREKIRHTCIDTANDKKIETNSERSTGRVYPYPVRALIYGMDTGEEI
jgi:hypothetical protein